MTLILIWAVVSFSLAHRYIFREEYILLKAGADVNRRSWKAFRWARHSVCNFSSFLFGTALFLAGASIFYIIVLPSINYLVILFGTRIFYKTEKLFFSQNSF